MKLLLSTLIAASAIFTAQAQSNPTQAMGGGYTKQIEKLERDVAQVTYHLHIKLDSLYEFVHMDRPAKATISDMLVFKTRLMQYVTDMQKREDARIDSLVSSIKYELDVSRFPATVFSRYLNKVDSLEKRIKFLEKIPIFPGPDGWDEHLRLQNALNGDDAQPAYPSEQGIIIYRAGSDSSYNIKKPVKIIKKKAIPLKAGNPLREYNPNLTWVKVPGKGMYAIRWKGEDTFFTYKPKPQKNYVIDASPGGYIKVRVK